MKKKISDFRLPIADLRNSIGVSLFSLKASQTHQSTIGNLKSEII